MTPNPVATNPIEKPANFESPTEMVQELQELDKQINERK